MCPEESAFPVDSKNARMRAVEAEECDGCSGQTQGNILLCLKDYCCYFFYGFILILIHQLYPGVFQRNIPAIGELSIMFKIQRNVP